MHGQSVAVSPGAAAGARKVFEIYWGAGAEDDWTAERYCVGIWATNLGEQFLRTDSLAGAMARRSWLRYRLVVTRPVEFHGGRTGGPRAGVPEAACASSNVGRCTQLACEDGRNPLTESVASLNMSFSGLELPKWPSLRIATRHSKMVGVAKQAFCVQKRPSANQNARHPSIFCLTPGSSVTRDISHHKS